MKPLLIALSFAALLSCGNDDNSAEVSEVKNLTLFIEKRDQHPSLADHSRFLMLRLNGKKIAEVELYPDPGAGVPLHYVVTPKQITAVDGNGVWYRATGSGIKKIGWHWMKPIPAGATYRISKNSSEAYEITELASVELGDIYAYKDPSD